MTLLQVETNQEDAVALDRVRSSMGKPSFSSRLQFQMSPDWVDTFGPRQVPEPWAAQGTREKVLWVSFQAVHRISHINKRDKGLGSLTCPKGSDSLCPMGPWVWHSRWRKELGGCKCIRNVFLITPPK